MNTVLLPTNDSLSMEKSAIFASEFDPLFSRLLVPVHLFLEKDMIVFLLKATLKKHMVE
jgi:hypothetical protein